MSFNADFLVNTFWLALGGIPVTLKLTFFSLLAASPIAFLAAMARIHEVRGAKQLVAVYVSFIRGTPMVLQILLVYSMLPSLLNALVQWLGLPFNVFGLSAIWYGYTVFTLNSIATLSEVFRSALLTVDRGQLEAAIAVGIPRWRAYTRIILPQALAAALPVLCNVTISLLKGTSLAFMMTIKDITAIAKVEAGFGYNYLEAYIDIFLIYLLVCTAVQLAFALLERGLSRYKRLARDGN